ncbi:protein of unknown function [Cupriavidus taiwanensis]|uniref:Uncharacterized protein n=1 Tax=Cupriavidus taiwanensis TaxID=164546 RepID=A0A9Q7UT26_9BURK|nr:protein of unknown function [Cupriavidus taiwanensis]
MAAQDVGHLARMHEHALDLGRLVRAPQPALEPDIGAPARARPPRGLRHHRRQVAGAKADQRIVAVAQHRHHHLAGLAFGHGARAAGLDDLDQHALVHHPAVAAFGFIRDQPDIGGAVHLLHAYPAIPEPVAQRRRQGLARDQRLGQAGAGRAEFIAALQQQLEERRRAGIGGRLQARQRLHLRIGLADAGREHAAAQPVGAAFHHHAGRGEVVGEGVVDQVAGAKAGGVHGAGGAPPVGVVAVGLVDRAGRLEHVAQLAQRRRVEPAQRRQRALACAQVGLARHRQLGQCRARGQQARIDAIQQFGKVWRLVARMGHLACQGGKERLLADFRRAGFERIEVFWHGQCCRGWQRFALMVERFEKGAETAASGPVASPGSAAVHRYGEHRRARYGPRSRSMRPSQASQRLRRR